MNTFYVLQNARLSRKDNDIVVTNMQGKKKNLKSEVIDEIYVFGETDLNTKLLNFMAQKGIILHVFNYYGFYSGSFQPKEANVSGYFLVKQVECYKEIEKRLEIAKEIIFSAYSNIYRNLRYYNGRGTDIKKQMLDIESISHKIKKADSINELMGYEGNIRKLYYSAWNDIVKQDINFDKRVKRPPDNMINTLISFINSLVYTTCLAEIYKTHLDPTISFLHEPGTRRFSLSLDVSEIFKPLIADRMIFAMLNKMQITENDFEKKSNYLYLKDSGKRKILEEYDKRLENTIMHKELERKVSYRYLIRLECYKLIKHILGEKEYQGFKIWW